MLFGWITRRYEIPFHLANGGIEFKPENREGQGNPIRMKPRLLPAERYGLRTTEGQCFRQKVLKMG